MCNIIHSEFLSFLWCITYMGVSGPSLLLTRSLITLCGLYCWLLGQNHDMCDPFNNYTILSDIIKNTSRGLPIHHCFNDYQASLNRSQANSPLAFLNIEWGYIKQLDWWEIYIYGSMVGTDTQGISSEVRLYAPCLESNSKAITV